MSDRDKEWQVWSEGYVISGGKAGAEFWGEFPGKTLRDAVLALKASLPEDEAKYINTDDGRLDYWGCRFFDNGNDAVKAFG